MISLLSKGRGFGGHKARCPSRTHTAGPGLIPGGGFLNEPLSAASRPLRTGERGLWETLHERKRGACSASVRPFLGTSCPLSTKAEGGHAAGVRAGSQCHLPPRGKGQCARL